MPDYVLFFVPVAKHRKQDDKHTIKQHDSVPDETELAPNGKGISVLSGSTKNGMIKFYRIGKLNLRLDSSRKPFNPLLDATFEKFICASSADPDVNGLTKSTFPLLTLSEEERDPDPDHRVLLLSNDTWDLWEEPNRDFIFQFKHYKIPIFSISVDHNFGHGKIHWTEAGLEADGISVKDILDLRMYLNWLANFGDLVLHASGFIYEGKGYCFLGESGRGKSTLVRDLAGEPGLTVLGEDQVILRYLDGQFRIFGTPWHSDPEFCSPLDAPLEKMFFLDREQQGTIREMTPLEVSTRILQTAFVPWYRPECLPLILERMSLLAESTRCLGLSYQLGKDGLETLLRA